MERSKIPMLIRFDTISHIMPYYGHTHRAFLLLSSLCSDTRSKLDEFYDEFVACMKENWGCIKAYSTKQKIHKFLPSDLFEVSVECRNQEKIGIFIKFILNLRDSEGWYFNSHYMHSKIKIRDPIWVDIVDIKKLSAYVDEMKSIHVILCKENTHSSKIKYESGTLDTNCNYVLIK